MMVIENKYDLEQRVYLITDEEQLPRIITKISIMPGNLMYELSQGHCASEHYEFEITDTKQLTVTGEL